ncbi:hypothetical protein DYBT9275_01504 [Dyadobacter sp. CECT 9275]|uniref:DUF1684 domain-containing protein n=1 Tax=Dyadobacter helix TaxID=2822344 RepID=A0A916JA71_9BACT|nr:DUF1684 domain-containing protein [Dyadobacter sp. CECT 9275]CAG4994951.1 hypothetical protein DYBT9275_01504 [Dyadobacter sp. CECT 9275]
MFKNKVIRYSTIAMVLAVLAYFFVENFTDSGTGDPEEELIISNPKAYIDKINEERRTKDELFRTGADSPIKDKAAFHGLHYFKVNPEYRVKANIVPYTGDDKELIIKYTDGTTDQYERYGYAHFSINDQPQKLLLLKHESVISLLFRDETSGKETYGGGRYLDYPLSEIKNNTIILDFNKAYNPYCAYQESYACPVPPAENKMSIPIFAGEQTEESVH